MSLDIYLEMTLDTGNVDYCVTLFDANITHNVAPMWIEAGVYDALYESDGKYAGDISEILINGLIDMKRYPEKYRAMNPANGWGNYEGALKFLDGIATACMHYPKALIRISA